MPCSAPDAGPGSTLEGGPAAGHRRGHRDGVGRGACRRRARHLAAASLRRCRARPDRAGRRRCLASEFGIRNSGFGTQAPAPHRKDTRHEHFFKPQAPHRRRARMRRPAGPGHCRASPCRHGRSQLPPGAGQLPQGADLAGPPDLPARSRRGPAGGPARRPQRSAPQVLAQNAVLRCGTRTRRTARLRTPGPRRGRAAGTVGGGAIVREITTLQAEPPSAGASAAGGN